MARWFNALIALVLSVRNHDDEFRGMASGFWYLPPRTSCSPGHHDFDLLLLLLLDFHGLDLPGLDFGQHRDDGRGCGSDQVLM